MQKIINNPYRILGVLAGASNREITRQANNLKKYITAGVELPVDFSFAKLDNFQRTVEDIDNAIERNDTDSQKIENALFWFWKGNDITDEPAFDALKKGKIVAALNIWYKQIIVTNKNREFHWREVSEKNASAFHNFFVASYLTNRDVNLFNAIIAQIFFLESDYWQNFKAAVTDITFNASKKELQFLFLNMLTSEKVIGIDKLVTIIEKTDFVAKADFLKNISKIFIERITIQIDISEKKRKECKANAAIAGENLYPQTQADLKQLKGIFGEQNLSYSNIADKVANEILQCSIDYFNDSQEKELGNDYYERTKKLAKIAQNIAVGSVTKGKVNENINTLEKMKNQIRVKKYFDRILELLENSEPSSLFERCTITTDDFLYRINVARELIEESKPDLACIKTILQGDDLYWDISTRVASQTLQDVIEAVNTTQEGIKKLRFLGVDTLKIILKNAWEVMQLIGSLDMQREFHSHYEANKGILKNLCNQFQILTPIKQYAKIPQLNLIIIGSDITNTDKENKPLPITNPLYKKYTRYIGLKLYVEVFGNKKITIYEKYIGIDGKLSSNSEISPKGYTKSVITTVNTNTTSIDLSGWGNSEQCTYDIGTHYIEIYVDDYMIYKKQFVVDLAPSEKLELKLKKAQNELKKINNTNYYSSEIENENLKMKKIKKIHLFRKKSEKQRQVIEQQSIIDILQQKAVEEKKQLIEQQNKIIYDLKQKIKNAKY